MFDGNSARVNITVRLIVEGWGQGPTHSQICNLC